MTCGQRAAGRRFDCSAVTIGVARSPYGRFRSAYCIAVARSHVSDCVHQGIK